MLKLPRLLPVCATPSHQRLSATTRVRSQTALFIGQVWPERTSSAAGVRTADLINAFQGWGWQVSFLSASAPNEHTALLQQQGCRTYECAPNREEHFTGILQQVQPTVCVFDRFYSEEAYSFRVRSVAPNTLRVLDMQDMHSLRKARQKAVEDGASLSHALTCQPVASDLELQRELASIHRADLTLVCSPYELTLLRDVYSIPHSKLCGAPFFTAAHAPQQPFSSREHFMTIGTWKHPPNRDGVRWLCLHIWPAIRHQLPHAQLHIYGAHMAGAAQQYHKPAAGVHVKGFAPSLDMMQQYRVCLAPLRFGAGLKGKIVDSWAHGTPVCTTPMGAEGMFPATSHSPEGFPDAEAGCEAAQGSDMGWGGLWRATDAERFAADAVQMYTSEEEWHVWQERGFQLLNTLYNKADRLKTVQVSASHQLQMLGMWSTSAFAMQEAISTAVATQEQRRSQDFIGQMLWSQQLRATEYFSRWIELKEQNKRR